MHADRKQPATAPRRPDLAAAVAAMPVAVVVFDSAGVATIANRLAEQMLGVAPLTGRRVDAILGHEGAALLGRARDGGGMVRGEMPFHRADGGAGWVEASVAPAPWGEIMMSLADVTVARSERDRLDRERLAAEEAVQAKMRFFAAASHDLRQPLQAMALFVSALQSHVDKPQAKNIFGSLKTSLKSMEEMFESLLDMSRLDAGVLKPDPKEFMIGDVLQTLEDEFAGQAEQSELRLRVVPCSAAVFSDGAMLTRILRNFMSNAVRYTRNGGKVLVGCRRRGDVLRIEVWDSGIGIAADQVEEIFAEFFQGKTAQKRKGSGLGLAIVQRLAGLLGHRLDLRSVEGRGSMFAVEVPMVDPGFAAMADDEDDEAGECDVGGALVLVVDDDREILEGVELLLAQWGGRALTATSAEEALRRIEQENVRPDLILVDFQLTTATGGEPAISALQQVLGEAVPAFVFTGATELEAGSAFPVLRKPLQPGRLREVVAEALGR